MLNGHFENCYGLKQFDLPNINFSRCDKAMIYAPNGVMKSSLSKVFDDISKGTVTSDRIFRNVVSSYSVTHYTSSMFLVPLMLLQPQRQQIEYMLLIPLPIHLNLQKKL